MKYFIDTEFIEDGSTIDLISIGMVWENGEYYAISEEFDPTKADDWVKQNVLTKLPPKTDCSFSNFSCLYKSRKQIKEDILTIVADNDNKPLFYGWYADYDWVVFCQLFGKMIHLPPNFPRYCRDVKQISDMLANPRLPQNTDEHNALEDAKWTMKVYNYLTDIQSKNF